jgi:Flp pilus assembly protein TadB
LDIFSFFLSFFNLCYTFNEKKEKNYSKDRHFFERKERRKKERKKEEKRKKKEERRKKENSLHHTRKFNSAYQWYA